jgi:hypothetical protein
MEFLKDEGGQGAAEYILLFGGVIVVAIAALLIYQEYLYPGVSPFKSSEDIQNIRSSAESS